MSEKRILALGEKYGFTSSPRRGFIGMQRSSPAGDERLDVFFWSNKEIADARGLPRSYIVLDIGGDRYRLPQVEWPSDTQARRPWADIEAEFDQVFAPLLTLPEGEKEAYRETLDANPRYRIPR